MNRKRKTWVYLAGLAGFVLLLQLSGILPLLSSFSQRVAGPVFGFTKGSSHKISDVLGAFFKIGGLAKDNNELKAKLAEIAGRLAELEDVRQENEALYAQLKVKQTKGWTLMPARVLSFTGAGFEDALLLDKGTRHGIKDGMVVVVENNLVGKIIHADPFTSSMRLLTNPSSTIVAQISEKKATGVIRGKLGAGILGLEEVELNKKIKAGDLVSTAKISRELPPGLIIGLVEDVYAEDDAVFQSAKVRPILDYNSLDVVFIVIRTKE